jgi:hypothetical protein
VGLLLAFLPLTAVGERLSSQAAQDLTAQRSLMAVRCPGQLGMQILGQTDRYSDYPFHIKSFLQV